MGGRTDKRDTACGITSLCLAPRGKNSFFSSYAKKFKNIIIYFSFSVFLIRLAILTNQLIFIYSLYKKVKRAWFIAGEGQARAADWDIGGSV